MRTTLNPYIDPLTNLRRPKGKTPEEEAQRLRDTAREFESLMMEHMVREMRKATPKSELLGREFGQELFNEMLDGEMVRLMVQRGGIGMTEFIVKAMEK